MALKTFVKISNISSLSDARYCSGMMVDVLGFNIDPSTEKPISLEDFMEISDWVAGVEFAGELHNASLDQIKEVIQTFPVDWVELTNLDHVEPIRLIQKNIIFRLVIKDQNDLDQLKSKLSYLDELVQMVILRCENPSLHESLDSQIGYYNGNLRLVKGYGIESAEHLDKYPGLEMEASEEERPGYQDYGRIMDVLESIEED